MKNLLIILAFFFSCFSVFGQTYLAPSNGSTTYNTCGGTFYDSGGSGGNYSNNENSVTTLCGTGGQCVEISFTAFSLRFNDILTIHDGPSQFSPQIAGWNGGTTVPAGTFTSTTGCLTIWFTSNNSQNRPGWAASINCVPCPTPADYIMPTVGINNEYVGSCMVSDCGPFTFADDGNTFGNYSNGINQIYRTFCPDQAGMCMSVSFNSYDFATNQDFLTVQNGPTQNSPVIANGCTQASAFGAYPTVLTNTMGAGPCVFTSTDPSGCLTFRNYTNGNTTAAGWDATLTCTPCAGGPNGTDNNDCMNLTPLCSSATINSNASGPGISAEGCTGSACPAGGENHTNWYAFQAQTSGTLNININPTTGTDDYDFAIYGPNVSCGSLGNPVRCTDSGVQGATGMNGSNFDNTEDVTGNSFLATMNVVAGDSYFLVIDEWSPNAGSGYQLSFSGSASLDCTILPVELSRFEAEYLPETDEVGLFWSTDSERDNDRFEVEHSTDGINFEIIHTVKGAGTTNNATQYYMAHPDPSIGINYYRLNQWDYDGNGKYSDIVSVNILDDFYDILSVVPNPTSGKTEVVFNSYNQGYATLNVVSSDGKTIVDMPIQTTPGGNRFELDLSDQENGLYLISIVTKDKVHRSKVVKK